MCITTNLLFDYIMGKKNGLVFPFVLTQHTAELFVLLLLWTSNKYLAQASKSIQLKLQGERNENSSTLLILEQPKCVYLEDSDRRNGEIEGHFCKYIHGISAAEQQLKCIYITCRGNPACLCVQEIKNGIFYQIV